MRFRICLATALAGSMTCGHSYAQNAPSSPISQGVVWTPSQWLQAFQSYVNVNGGSATNLTLTTPTISNGTINGASIGQSVPSAGAFTTISGSMLRVAQIAQGDTGVRLPSGEWQLNTVQGTVMCQAGEAGQLTSPTGICMQYTPSVQQEGGAAAIFGLQGALADYASPPLTLAAAASAGATSIVVNSDPSIANLSVWTGTSGSTGSVITSNIQGAIPAGTYFVPPASTDGTQDTFLPGATTTTITLSAALTAAMPQGSTVQFTTPTTSQQYTGLASSVDLTPHQTGGQAWGGNFIVQAEPGSSGHIFGIETDMSNLSGVVSGYGYWAANNGNTNINAAFFAAQGVQNKSWNFSVWSTAATMADFQGNSLAGNFIGDGGVHTNGMVLGGQYSAWALEVYANPTTGLTPAQQVLAGITPKGGIIDNSLQYTAAASGGTYAGVNGTTGISLVCTGTLASYTVTLPTAPLRNQFFRVMPECTVTSLTVGSRSFANVAPGSVVSMIYDGDRSTWWGPASLPGTALQTTGGALSGDLTGTTAEFSGAVTAAGVINTANEGVSGTLTVTGNITGQTAWGKQGIYTGSVAGIANAPGSEAVFGWNCSGGSGEACILNQGSAGGPQGFGVFQETSANNLSSAKRTLTLDKTGNLSVTGTVQPASYTVSTLPSACTAGQTAYASDARNSGEAAGSGTGSVVYCNKNAAWFANGAAVTN